MPCALAMTVSLSNFDLVMSHDHSEGMCDFQKFTFFATVGFLEKGLIVEKMLRNFQCRIPHQDTEIKEQNLTLGRELNFN